MPTPQEANAALATLVRQRWTAALSERQTNGAHQRILECFRAYEGVPITGCHQNPEIPVVMNITAPIINKMQALFVDAVNSVGDGLFDLVSTAQPDIPEDVTANIEAALRVEIKLREMTQQPTDPQSITPVAEDLYSQAQADARKRADAGAKELKAMVMDFMQEKFTRDAKGEGRSPLMQLVSNFIRYPAAFVRLNAFEQQPVRRWENGVYRIVRETVRTVRVPNPMNVFPSKGALNAIECDYIIEILPGVSGQTLADLAAMDGYDRQGIVDVFTNYPRGYHESYQEQTQKVLSGAETVNPSEDGLYDVLIMNGRVPGWQLKEFGVVVGNENAAYEAEIMVVGNHTIRAVTNSSPDGIRPIRAMSYEPSDCSIWGHCPASRLVPIQRACTSSIVNSLEEMMFGGAHIEVDPRRMHADEPVNPAAARARKVRLVKADGTGQPAYKITEVVSQSAMFYTLFEKFQAQGYTIVGLSPLAAGESDVGTIGRTSGGVAAVLNQSSKGLKEAMQRFESSGIEPVVQAEADWILSYDPKAPRTVDAQVLCRGLTKLIEQAHTAASLEWALQSVSAFAGKPNETGQPIIPTNVIPLLLFKLFQAKGIDPTGVLPDFDREQRLGKQLTRPPDVSYTPQIPLDGRSAAAAGAIQTANNPMGAIQ